MGRFSSLRRVVYKTEQDLADRIVAVQADTTSHYLVQDLQKKGIAIKEIKAYGGATEAFAAQKAGHADLIVIDEPVGRYYAKQDSATFTVTGQAATPEPFGIAIRKEDTDLAQEIAKAVEAMKQDGTIKKLSENWFGGELGK